MHRSFATPEPTSVYVECGSGEVRVAAEEVTETTVEVTTRNDRDLDDVVIEQRGEQIVVITPRKRGVLFGNGASFGIEVRMPTGSDLATQLGSADLEVSGELDNAHTRTGSGEIRLQRVSGEARPETGSGDIDIAEVGGTLQARTGSGDIEVRLVRGTATMTTGSGDIDVERAEGTVQAKCGSGDVTIGYAAHDVSAQTASGDVTVDQAGHGSVSCSNVSGDITIGVPEGTPVWTDVSSVSGEVESELESVGRPAEGQDYVELRANTVTGSVHLEQR